MQDIMKQVDNNLLIPIPNRSSHNLDQQIITTTGFGRITPVFMMETVPGGSYTINPETLVRFQPLASPLMHKCTAKTMYFHVPYRILWKNWETFIMGKKDKDTDLEPQHPFYPAQFIKDAGVGVNGVSNVRLCDYFGVKAPTVSNVDIDLNPFPLAAYQKIFNRYFRHKNVQEEVVDELTDGGMTIAEFNELTKLRAITYTDDYFNSMLPTPQKGNPIYIDDNAVVKYSPPPNAAGQTIGVYTDDLGYIQQPVEQVPDVVGQLYAEVQINVEEIRRATALQKVVEVANHANTYIDYLKANFNVNFPDGRAQEPEYITGSSQPIIISDVANTATDQQGRIVGTASGYSQGQRETYYAYEHGLIIGISVVTYDPLYLKACNRLHWKLGRFDYFNPMLDTLGEQAIYRGELNGVRVDSRETLGYGPRHHEYRNSFSSVTGEMATSYMHYHLARNYVNATLTESFYNVLEENRIFAFQSQEYDPIIMQVYSNVQANLPMGELPHASVV